jgi:hypothetical protein
MTRPSLPHLCGSALSHPPSGTGELRRFDNVVGEAQEDDLPAGMASRRRLDPLRRPKSALSAQPPRTTRFGSPLEISRVHWVEPTPVAEITYLPWTGDGLLRRTVYVGLREDKPADQVRRERQVSTLSGLRHDAQKRG